MEMEREEVISILTQKEEVRDHSAELNLDYVTSYYAARHKSWSSRCQCCPKRSNPAMELLIMQIKLNHQIFHPFILSFLNLL